MMYASKKGYSSSLISGYAWDTVCEFLASKNIDIHHSNYYGNYDDSTGLGKKNGVKNLAGIDESWKTYNIYDLAGNVEEFTTENYGSDSSETITRGGSYFNSNVGIVFRYNPDKTASYNVGFRVILYKDDNKVVDINPPTIGGVEDGEEYNSNVGVTFRDDSGSCTALYWYNSTKKEFSGSGTPFNSNHQFTSDGWYKVVVTDSVGNSKQAIFKIDKTAPTKPTVKVGTLYTSGGESENNQLYFKQGQNVTCTWGTDVLTPIDHKNLLIEKKNGNGWYQYSSTGESSVYVSQEGEYRVKASNDDNLGNYSECAYTYFCLDWTAPTFTVNGNPRKLDKF